LAMNYARPAIRSWRNDTGTLMPVARQGAGRVDAARSATAMTVVRSPGGIAEVGLGNIHITSGRSLVTRTLTVHNLAATEKTYASGFQFAFPGEDEGQGVEVSLEPATLTVPGGAVGMLTVEVSLAADDVRPYSLPAVNPIANEAAFQEMEVDGYVAITEVDSSGQPVPEGDQALVPFHTWPVRDSCVKLEDGDPIDLTVGGDPGVLRWTNDCSADGQAAVFAELGTDPEEEANPGKLNIVSVAARIGPSPDLSSPGCRTLLEWAITTSGPRRIAYDTEFRVFVDADGDSALDTVIWSFYGPELSSDAGISLPAGTWWVGHAPLKVDADTERPLPEPDEAAMGQDILPLPFRVDERVATLPVCWDNLGIKGPSRSEKFEFAVSAADYTEDYPVSDDYLGYDLAPSDMEDGGRFTFDRGAVGCIRVVDGDGNVVNAPGTSALVPGNGEASAEVTSSCGGQGLGTEVRLVSAAVSNEPTGDPLAWRGVTIGVASAWLPYVAHQSVLVVPPEPTAVSPEPTAVPPEPTQSP